MGCTGRNTLNCLRSKTTRELQERNTFNLPLPYAADAPLYQWLPVIDNEFIPDYTYRTFKAGKVVPVPAIIGDETNGGTDFAPRDASSVEDSNLFMVNQYPALTPALLGKLNNLYPNPNKTCPAEGCFWRQTSDVYGDARFMCPALFMAASIASLKPPQRAWAYRYNVEDPAQIEVGLGVPHTVEHDAMFDDFDQKTPESYLPGGINDQVGAVLRGYWTSFVRAFDPNAHRVNGSARWESWVGRKGPESRRMEFKTGAGTGMEDVSRVQQKKCEFWTEYGDELLI
jgi:carboxylesterase type B